MSQYEHQILHAPRGMDSASDIALLREDTARLLVGLYQNNEGRLTIPHNTYIFYGGDNLHPASQRYTIDGVTPYYGADKTKDLVMFVQQGQLFGIPVAIWRGQPLAGGGFAPPPVFSSDADTAAFVWCAPLGGSAPTSPPPLVAQPVPFKYAGQPFTTGSPGLLGHRVRAVQYKTELIFVQDNGLPQVRYADGSLATARPWRFNGTDLFLLGIEAPAHVPTTSLGGTGLTGGPYQYEYTYVDELGRESSPSGLSGAVSPANQTVTVTVSYSPDPQVQTINLYRNASGGALWYLVATINNVLNTGGGTTTYADTTADSVLQASSLAPLAGENNVPLNASLVAIHKSRIWLNNVAAPNDVQVSNTDLPTQYNVLANPNLPSDGLTMRVGADPGDDITGLFSFGSLMGVFKRKTYFQIWGDDITSFIVRPVLTRGCIAPDTIVRCDNVVCFLSEDGVYAMSFEDGFTVTKMSTPLDNHFKSYYVTYTDPVTGATHNWPRSFRAKYALGWYIQNRYHVVIPPYVYMWSFAAKSSDSDQVGGWSEIEAITAQYDAYSCACTMMLEREVPIVLYSTPQESFFNGSNFLYVDTWYTNPNQQTLRHFVYRTRGFDGKQPHRTNRKRARRLTIFGRGDRANFNNFVLTVSADDLYTEVYGFNLLQQADMSGNSINADEQLIQRWQQERILFQQEFSPNLVGYVIDVRLEGYAAMAGSANGIEINDVKLEYQVIS